MKIPFVLKRWAFLYFYAILKVLSGYIEPLRYPFCNTKQFLFRSESFCVFNIVRKINMKKKSYIEIIRSSETTLSSMSQISSDAIESVLNRHYEKVGVSIVNSLEDMELVILKNPDLVFMGMKFVPTNNELGRKDLDKNWLATHFDYNGINYTGSGQSAITYELNKQDAKRRVMKKGIASSPYFVAIQGIEIMESDIKLEYPLFVKPTDRGGGLGVDDNSVVHNIIELRKKVKNISDEHDSDSLIEEFLSGREFSVAIIKNRYDGSYSQMPLELIAESNSSGVKVLGGSVKSENKEKVLKVEDPILNDKLSEFAQKAFFALGARDYGRIDIRLDKNDEPMFLEANLLPSLIDNYGNFPKACRLYKNMDHEDMILTLVNLGLSHKKSKLISPDLEVSVNKNEIILV